MSEREAVHVALSVLVSAGAIPEGQAESILSSYDRDNEIAQLLSTGEYTRQQIAEKVGVSVPTVGNAIKRLVKRGIRFQEASARRRAQEEQGRAERNRAMIRDYYVEGISQKEAAKRHGLSVHRFSQLRNRAISDYWRAIPTEGDLHALRSAVGEGWSDDAIMKLARDVWGTGAWEADD